ncbi:MAG: hypothetical protein ABIS51_09820 [Sphingomonas sp.]
MKDFGLARLAIPVRRRIPAEMLAAAIATPAAAAVGPIVRDHRIRDFRDLQVELPPIVAQPAAPPPPGYDRTAATLPIADTPNPTDTTVFADAAGTTQWYLPRYRLKLIDNSRYDIAMTELPEGGFRLALGFERFCAPELAAVAGAQELPHDPAIGIEYTAQSGLPKAIALSELLLDGTAVAGAAAHLTLQERDSLMNAMKHSGVRLIFRRAISVAAQIPGAAAAGPIAQLIMLDAIKPHMLTAIKQDTGVWKGMASVRARRLRQIDVVGAGMIQEPFLEVPPAPSTAPRYQDVSLVLEQAREAEPLVLDETLHAYFYANGPRPNAGVALTRIQVLFVGDGVERHHSYFQDGDDRALFYYLPDAMRLARVATEPFLPEMKVRMESVDGSLGAATATIDYAARPFVLPGRLAAALETLAGAIPATMVANDGTPVKPRLEPLPGRIKLKMRVPGAAGVEMRTFEDAAGDLVNGFRHSMNVTLAEFRQLFASAFAKDATSLFTGEAIVDVDAAGTEAVQVDIRFSETEGPLFDSAETSDADGAVAVRLRNATESPLRIRHLPVRLLRGGGESDGQLDGLDLAQPVEIAPGNAISFRVRPGTPLPGEGACDAVFDFADVDILADPDGVLPVISDTSVPAEYVRAVEVMALPEMLDAEHPDGPIVLINVEFESGDPVKVTKAAPDVVAAVRLPLVNMLLGRDTKGAYAFRQQVIRRSGAQTRDDDWRRSDFGILVVPVTG